MLLKSSASSSVEASMSFASNHGDQGLLCEWVPAQTWQNCSCSELPKDGSELLTPCNLCGNSGPNLVCKRRKVHKNSVIVFPETGQACISAVKKGPLETPIEHESNVVTPVILGETSDSSFVVFNGFHHSQRVHDDSCLQVKCSLNSDADSEYQIVASNKELSSDNTSSPESEIEVLDEDLSIRELCFYVLKSYGSHATVGDWSIRSSASAEVLRTCNGSSCKSCKLCGYSDKTLNMLLCDYCDEAFHASCCNPKIKILPIDNWFCHHCSKLNCKVSQENSFLKLPSIGWSNGITRFEMGPIALMLKYPEPYKSRVRIGESFQADVPDWADQISNDDDCIGEPLEIDPVEIVGLHVYSSGQFPKPSYISNWLQCREVLCDDTRGCIEGTICGKWRRAPFSELQTDDWDCSCSVLWDPTHSDCAVCQEVETDEVLRHLEYVEQVVLLSGNLPILPPLATAATLHDRLLQQCFTVGCYSNALGWSR